MLHYRANVELFWEKVARQTLILLFISFFFFLYHTKIDSIVEARVLSKNIDSQNSYVVGIHIEVSFSHRKVIENIPDKDENAIRVGQIT